MSELVVPFMFGGHMHYEGMTACPTCEQENDQWDKLVKRTHTYQLAKMLTRTKAYKAYRQARPYDDAESVLSLDTMLEGGNMFENDSDTLLDAYARVEELERFRDVLSPKQLHILDLLLAGLESRDIYRGEGYKSTGGVRYHKHIIRKKYRDFPG